MPATRGERERHFTQPRDAGYDYEECPDCSGRGLVFTHDALGSTSDVCQTCDGLGYLVPDGDALADEAGDKRYDQEGDR